MVTRLLVMVTRLLVMVTRLLVMVTRLAHHGDEQTNKKYRPVEPSGVERAGIAQAIGKS
jgi:hypothetical protein